MAKLKVYCTPIGFHDAYVAASSQKAALAAWGSDADLFARKQAQVVDDPQLVADALARPGEVIKRVRGSTQEHLAALPASSAKPAAPSSKRKRAPLPRPSRDALDALEAELAEARAAFEAQLADVTRREQELARERKQLQKQRDEAVDQLEQRRKQAASRYNTAMEQWRTQ